MGRRVEKGNQRERRVGRVSVNSILVDLKRIFICWVTPFGSSMYPSDVDSG
jgi:hypothetical protein